MKAFARIQTTEFGFRSTHVSLKLKEATYNFGIASRTLNLKVTEKLQIRNYGIA